jgi:CRP/FNR family transcriptional regulator
VADRDGIAKIPAAGSAGARDCRDYRISCSNCRLSSICLPIALQAAEVDRLDAIIQRGRPLQKGEHVYREKQPFTSVYAVRSGTLKTYSITDGGEEQVTGFYFPGDVFGMDGMSRNEYACSAVALETAVICRIPFEHLGGLSARIPSLQRHFFQLMSQEITQNQQLIALLSKSSSEQRIASLLLSISARYARYKLSPTEFRLPMSRTDIGNYFGMALETVSRVFTRFQKTGLVAASNRELAILDAARLCDIASGKTPETCCV